VLPNPQGKHHNIEVGENSCLEKWDFTGSSLYKSGLVMGHADFTKPMIKWTKRMIEKDFSHRFVNNVNLHVPTS
jgi:hypothetical protein